MKTEKIFLIKFFLYQYIEQDMLALLELLLNYTKYCFFSSTLVAFNVRKCYIITFLYIILTLSI